MNSIELRTSEDWQNLNPEIIVCDPDGWDRKNFKYSWNEELISKEEYEKRKLRSTCLYNPNSVKMSDNG